jgi:hypothetical protein
MVNILLVENWPLGDKSFLIDFRLFSTENRSFLSSFCATIDDWLTPEFWLFEDSSRGCCTLDWFLALDHWGGGLVVMTFDQFGFFDDDRLFTLDYVTFCDDWFLNIDGFLIDDWTFSDKERFFTGVDSLFFVDNRVI